MNTTTTDAPAPAALRLYWALLAALALAWLGCEAAALAGFGESPAYLVLYNVGQEPHLTVALGSVFFLHFASRPGSRDLLAAAALGLVAGAGLYVLRLSRGLDALPANAVFAGVGAASLCVLAWRAWRSHGSRRARVLGALLPAALLAGGVALSLYLLTATVWLCPATDDALLYAADGGLGTQVSFAVGRLFRAAPLLATFALAVYNLVPAAFVLLLALYQRADPSLRRTPFPAFLLASVVGYAMYLLFPAVGPVYAFGPAFPDDPPAAADVLAGALATPPVLRNCMPSLHTTWALLLVWHARPLARWVRVVAAVFLVFTLLATLGLGLHYAVDLVVAFPFALAVQAALARRLAPLALGTGLVVTWLLLLRFGLPLVTASPPLTVAGALATVAVSWLVEHRLYRATAPLSLPAAAALHPVRHLDEQVAGQDQPAAEE
jgi:hypothetical protein